MMEHSATWRDGERDLVQTCSQVVHEGDVTSWSSVFRVLVAVMFSALVNSAAHPKLNV